MERFHRIGVYLTGSPADVTALRYAARIATLAKAGQILCVRVTDETSPIDQAPDVDETREEVFAELPAEMHGIAEFEAPQGSGLDAVLRNAVDHELDLIVKGRRLPSAQLAVGAAFTRLARKSPCSVLVVPQFFHTHTARMLVEVDFSEHSRLALDVALAIARANLADGKHAQVLVQTVYNVGYGYSKLGLGFAEAVRQRGEAAEKQMQHFLADVNASGIEFDHVCTCSENVAGAVGELAAAHKMDAIVAGSRGLSASAAMVLGSTTEQILLNAATPVLVVKKKGETIGLLRALLYGD